MSSRKVPLTFTFHRSGVHPPLFVAGTFSKPPWQPLEMDASIDQHGDFIFTKQVMVNESSEIQYKFRHASGDWWALDPDADTVTDVNGNVNSLLYSPTQHAAQETTLVQGSRATKSQNTATSHDPEDPKDQEASVSAADETEDPNSPKSMAEQEGLRRLSFTPIEEVANTAAEVADTASHLDIGEDDNSDDNDDDDFEADSGDMLPMFSHECFASPSDSKTPGHHAPEQQRHENPEPSEESAEPSTINYDDPRLEPFPSDRDSIIATMRRLSTAIDVDPTMVDIVPLSAMTASIPLLAGGPSPTRGTFGADDANTSQKQTNDAISRKPVSATASKHSLQSIAEGEEAPDDNVEDTSGFMMEAVDTPTEYIGPRERRNFSLASVASSNEDEGISMGKTPRKRMNEEAPSIKAKATDGTHLPEEPTATNFVSNSPTESSEHNDESGLRKPTNGERPHSPTSVYSLRGAEKGNWLGTLLRTIFVDWIGDVVRWLCGRSRNQV
ncbi:hypothetical protein O1611_g5379 [Lasiodiplodia mahajangana]|uniref:Uncharacterized protein n=1 Tax=Lasiodiplodia mahajangana TaxID=1108764 RepID=A0ACC2JM30_9PEZI|nr:hypothetical protein O1611_g5379 [Lasiodiplodia mahajangana]